MSFIRYYYNYDNQYIKFINKQWEGTLLIPYHFLLY